MFQDGHSCEGLEFRECMKSPGFSLAVFISTGDVEVHINWSTRTSSGITVILKGCPKRPWLREQKLSAQHKASAIAFNWTTTLMAHKGLINSSIKRQCITNRSHKKKECMIYGASDQASWKVHENILYLNSINAVLIRAPVVPRGLQDIYIKHTFECSQSSPLRSLVVNKFVIKLGRMGWDGRPADSW